MRSERERLLDIQEAITRIEKYANLGKDAFLQDELIQNWIISQIAIIGEACRALPEEFQSKYANVPWADIVAMRNIVIHHYFGIDVEAVWSVVVRDIPNLKANVFQILADIDE